MASHADPLMPAQPYSADFVEREYNNRDLVPDHPAIFARWERDSEYAKRTLEARLDLAYGPDARHRLDYFPSRGGRDLLVFLHGGYWRALDKKFFAWIAPPFVAADVGVVNVNYRLCPQVAVADIVEDVRLAMNWLLAREADHGIAAERVVFTGHSAGGHLAAALFATERGRLAFDPTRIVGGVGMSGVYDLTPMPYFSANQELRLDEAEARRVSVHDKQPVVTAPFIVAAGGDETAEFQRQSRLLAQAWGPQVRECLILPGLNHFSILDGFIERGQPLHTATLGLFAR